MTNPVRSLKNLILQCYRKMCLIFIFQLLFVNNAFSQHKHAKLIDSIMTRYSEAGFFNGNVLVARNNKVIYSASFGFSDASKTNKLTPAYLFNIGSITKEFSAVALMQLQEQGKLKLDDKISKFIPELPKWANEVAIQDLLRYTSGVPNVNWKTVKSDRDILDGLMLVDTLDFKPGTDYDYNNNNIFLRQFIVERLTNMNFKEYAEKFIFKPCKMKSAELTPLGNEKNTAKGFSNKLIPDKPDLPITGGTYLSTTDLLKWSKSLHSYKVVSKNSVYELGQRFNAPETQSGLGVAKFCDKNLIEHMHDGRAGSYEAILLSDIDEKLTVILLDNNYNGKVFEISNAIVAILKKGKI